MSRRRPCWRLAWCGAHTVAALAAVAVVAAVMPWRCGVASGCDQLRWLQWWWGPWLEPAAPTETHRFEPGIALGLRAAASEQQCWPPSCAACLPRHGGRLGPSFQKLEKGMGWRCAAQQSLRVPNGDGIQMVMESLPLAQVTWLKAHAFVALAPVALYPHTTTSPLLSPLPLSLMSTCFVALLSPLLLSQLSKKYYAKEQDL